jgi:hypothetical protein
MPLCLKENCSQSCCTKFRRSLQKEVRYASSFLCNEEKNFILESNPDWVKKGLIVVPAKVRDMVFTAIGNCLGSHGCKLNPRPLLCKIYPFSLFTGGGGINCECDAWYDLASDAKLTGRVMQVRTQLGFTDNELWVKELRDSLLSPEKITPRSRGTRLFNM